MQNISHHPLLLIILDGFGYRLETKDNAIANAHKPNFDGLWQTCPHLLLNGSGRCVGLPDGQMGNSEVGHLNMGAGRILQQDLTRIDSDIENGTFNQNPVFLQAMQEAKEQEKAIHIMGLLSPGGVHSHEKHLHALLRLAANQHVERVYIHAFLDGRDTPPESATPSLQALENLCDSLKTGQIISLIGRYYAMDRDNRWDRIEKAYSLMVDGQSDYVATTASLALSAAYERGETDEFVKPTRITHGSEEKITIEEGDTVIFMNFRADRAREISHAFLDQSFSHFERKTHPRLYRFISLTEYDKTMTTADIAYPTTPLTHLFGEEIARHGLTQLRIAETEKYAHVTFFFNGGKETPQTGEDRILVPSPKIATYDQQPEMSAFLLTDQLTKAILEKRYDVIICNYANADMVGHTGNMEAAVKAIEALDICLGKIKSALEAVGGEMIITADHGNAECMFDPITQQPHTAHTSDPVPFIYYGRKAIPLMTKGRLSDIAPTMLYLLGLPIPEEMTGKPLVKLAVDHEG